MIAPSAIVLARPEDEVVSCSLAGEAALLHLRHGAYYGLDTVGAFVWGLIQPGLAVSAIEHALLQRFEVDQARCASDLQALLLGMAQADLIQIQEPAPEAHGSSATVGSAEAGSVGERR